MTDVPSSSPQPRLSRRAALGLGAAGTAAIALPSWVVAAPPARAAATHQALRSKWRRMLVGDYDAADPELRAWIRARDGAAVEHLSTLDTSAGRTRLWPELPLGTDPSNIRRSSDRLRAIALGYATPGSQLAGSDQAASAVGSALSWLLDRHYGAVDPYGNLWEWQIGTPLNVNDVCVLLRSELGTDLVGQAMTAVRRYAPSPLTYPGTRSATGANLAWTCLVGALRGANEESDTPLDTVRTGIAPVFRYVTDGDGFYRDGSFIQHDIHAYTGGYGISLLRTLTDFLTVLRDSEWYPPTPDRDNVFDWVRDAYEPVISRGVLLDQVRGREVSRSYRTGAWAGRSVAAAVLRLAGNIAAGAREADLRGLAKHWITTGYGSFFTYDSARPLSISPGLLAYARALVDDPSVTPRATAAGARVFAGMDRATLVRPGFTFGVAMASSRTGTYESINNENQRGWYQAAGATVLQTSGSPGQYQDAYWPTANPYRMPGTTVDTRSRAVVKSDYTTGERDWAGGAELGGRFAAVGLDHADAGSSLVARKSWFLVDDVVVCIGTGITASDGRRIETVVDSRNLGSAGTADFTVDGAVQPETSGWTATRNVAWTHLAGTGGYVFPDAASLRMLRETRTGRWGDITGGINPPIDTATYQRTYLSQWFDHGVDPSGAGYRYVLLPGATAAQTAAYSAEPTIRIVVPSPSVHFVNGGPLRLKMANFWVDGAPAVEGLQADRRCSVALHGFVSGGADHVEIGVCDPTQRQTGDILVDAPVAGPIAALAAADPGVSVVSYGSGPTPTVRLRVTVTGTRGATRTARLRYA